ncbi:MAG: MaoC family dehydratase [Actinobacteria bacterium]|nr:MAG: MaoC family dehydratase [Actinomycetota bacterium]
MRTIKGIEELKQLAGQELGSGDWHEVTQEQINQFADATGDHQWIHTDVERAKKGPFGGPIAHGYFTLSIIPVLLRDVMSVEGMRMGINYGLNKLRFPAPVPIGSKIRANVKCASVEEVSGGLQGTFDVTVEVDGQDKPGCVAQVIYRYYN